MVIDASGLAATSGVLNAANVFQSQAEPRGRHAAIALTGTIAGDGTFTTTIPFVNGWLRVWSVASIGAPVGGNIDMDALLHANMSLMAIPQTALGSGNSGGSSAEQTSLTNWNLLCCPLRIRITGANAGAQFALIILFKATG